MLCEALRIAEQLPITNIQLSIITGWAKNFHPQTFAGELRVLE